MFPIQAVLARISTIEKKYTELLPFMVRRADSKALVIALRKEQENTARQIERLDLLKGLLKLSESAPEPVSEMTMLEQHFSLLRSQDVDSVFSDVALLAIVLRIQFCRLRHYSAALDYEDDFPGHSSVRYLLRMTLNEIYEAKANLSLIAAVDEPISALWRKLAEEPQDDAAAEL